MSQQPNNEKRGRRTREAIERDWYDCFARWNREDRAAALKVLTILHDTLPEKPRAKAEPDKPDALFKEGA